MPLYIVRWPDLTACLVGANDEDDLMLTLDQVADPTGCEWQLYEGPVWVDVWPPARFIQHFQDDERPMSQEEFELGGLSELADKLSHDGMHALQMGAGDSDAGGEMLREICRVAFPNLWKLYDDKVRDEAHLEPTELDAALRQDLQKLLKLEWRTARGRQW